MEGGARENGSGRLATGLAVSERLGRKRPIGRCRKRV